MRLTVLFSLATSVLAFERDGNRITIPNPDGGIAIEFAAPVSLQYERWWGSKPPVRGAPLSLDSQSIKVEESADTTILTTRFLTVSIAKDGALSIKTIAGREVTSMPHAATREGFEFKTFPDEMLYGLGDTAARKLDLKGRTITSTRPFLLSSRGYGLYVPTAQPTFDLKSGIRVNATTFQLYYGPNPKEILEQHALTTHNQVDLEKATLANRDLHAFPKDIHPVDITEQNYCDSPRILNQLSLSGELFPALDLGKLGRHQQLLRLLPFLYDSKPHPELEQRRAPWNIYLDAYLREAHDRGLPFIRPLLMQFPQDNDTRQDLYMIGDEILVAPGCNVTEIELPRGSWTDLRSNARHPGRRKIANDPNSGLPIFAKAGSLLPLTGKNRLELHYFPNIGAEFFVYEPDVNEYSQFHAAPAGDFTRVESESRVERTCEWILHHTPKPKQVGETGKPFTEAPNRAALKHGTWFHDTATGNLHIVVKTLAHEDHIVNMSF